MKEERKMFCRKCGKEIADDIKYCPNCGCPTDINEANNFNSTNYVGNMNAKSKLAAGLLNILLPGVGRIYLGYIGIGVTQLILSFAFGIGWIWSFIDGILILTGSVVVDGKGNPLGQ